MARNFWGFWSPKKCPYLAILGKIWSNFGLKKVLFSLYHTGTIGHSSVNKLYSLNHAESIAKYVLIFLLPLLVWRKNEFVAIANRSFPVCYLSYNSPFLLLSTLSHTLNHSKQSGTGSCITRDKNSFWLIHSLSEHCVSIIVNIVIE